jgi:serine/threonine-protein kinase/endoribonuclease IRE1
MSRIVDASPFSLPNDQDRIFVGKKETSLLMLELETGALKGTLDSSSECPWGPFAESEGNNEVDLDELDGTKPPKEKPTSTKVLIGRTGALPVSLRRPLTDRTQKDYQLTIHTRPQSPSSRAHTQILNFSAYGPNNQDQAIQATYRRTPDDMYIQSTPDGDVLSFVAASPPNGDETDSDGRPPRSMSKLAWAHTFSKPM